MNGPQQRAIPIRFQLGDWTLFTVPLRLEEQAVQPIRDPRLNGVPECPGGPLPDGVEGYLFRSVPIESELPRITTMGDFLRYVPLQYRHGYIDLRTSFDTYQKRFSAKSRSTIARKLRRYADHCGGTILWRTFKTPGEMAEFVRLARRVSMRTYQEKLLSVGIPGSTEFLARAEALAANEQVRAYILFDGDRPVSYMYCPVEDSVVIYGYLGFDPDYFHWSVGTVLLRLAIEQLFEEHRFSHFDFTEGQSEQKRRFATHERRCANVFLVRRSARNTTLILGHAMMEKCSRWLGSTLDRIGAKRSVQRFLRAGIPATRTHFAKPAKSAPHASVQPDL
ncbi:MAG TPA: GNAT family N-acetyltransferase [Burkholderiaceae bacterium]|nr:GNAT family N-acetyltransferase [Burkholderiaceae bacterium]